MTRTINALKRNETPHPLTMLRSQSFFSIIVYTLLQLIFLKQELGLNTSTLAALLGRTGAKLTRSLWFSLPRATSAVSHAVEMLSAQRQTSRDLAYLIFENDYYIKLSEHAFSIFHTLEKVILKCIDWMSAFVKLVFHSYSIFYVTICYKLWLRIECFLATSQLSRRDFPPKKLRVKNDRIMMSTNYAGATVDPHNNSKYNFPYTHL